MTIPRCIKGHTRKAQGKAGKDAQQFSPDHHRDEKVIGAIMIEQLHKRSKNRIPFWQNSHLITR